jgi:hypothetical protein
MNTSTATAPRSNCFHARATVGRDFAWPCVQAATLH